MDRYKLLAAELLGVSYDQYKSHLGIGHARYEREMPKYARVLDQAAKEKWPLAQLAQKLDVDAQHAQHEAEKFAKASRVVDAPNPAESFREAVRQILYLGLMGTLPEDKLEALAAQICCRASDLGHLLEERGETLNRYSRHLRREAGQSLDDLDQEADEDDVTIS